MGACTTLHLGGEAEIHHHPRRLQCETSLASMRPFLEEKSTLKHTATLFLTANS